MPDEFADSRKRFQDFSDDEPGGVDRLVQRFLQSLDENLAGLRRALASKEAKEIARAAHVAVGACDMFGLTAIASLLRAAERAALADDVAGAEGLWTKIQAERGRVRSGLA